MKNGLGKALPMGIASAALFSSTYIINNNMSLSGCHWTWTAALRYIFTMLILGVGVLARGNMRRTLGIIRQRAWEWILWSTVGFGVFCAALTYASAYGASWLVAGTFQLTIFAGALLSPLFRDGAGMRMRIPVRLFPAFAVILAGIFLLQFDHAEGVSATETLIFFVPVAISAFAYPLGNRKMMEICPDRLPTLERIFGMCLCSMPFWLAVCIWGYAQAGWPPETQCVQALITAICSGTLATLLLFSATKRVKRNAAALAIVESCQSMEIVFTMLGGVLLLGNALPGPAGWVGIGLVVLGMAANSFLSMRSS